MKKEKAAAKFSASIGWTTPATAQMRNQEKGIEGTMTPQPKLSLHELQIHCGCEALTCCFMLSVCNCAKASESNTVVACVMVWY